MLRSISMRGPDLIIGTGDYLCAWGDQAPLARAQLKLLKEIIKANVPKDLRSKMRWAQGNHEFNHAELMRVYLSEIPYWHELFKGVHIIAAPSDAGAYLYPEADRRIREWLALPQPVTIYLRHEPPGSHGTRHDSEMFDTLSVAPPSLIIHGHEHKYARSGNAIIVGNSGAEGREGPLGYAIIEIKPRAVPVRVTAYDAITDQPIDTMEYQP